jgi:hypothetical protein
MPDPGQPAAGAERPVERPVEERADDRAHMGIQAGGPRASRPDGQMPPQGGPEASQQPHQQPPQDSQPGQQPHQQAPQAFGQAPHGQTPAWAQSAAPSPDSADNAPWPGADRPIPVTPVQFEAVEPNRTKRRVVFATISVVLAAAVGIGGYLLGTNKGDDKDAAANTGTSAPDATAAPSGSGGPAEGDPSNPEGFGGTALTGGRAVPEWQQITGPNGRVTFNIPRDWTPLVDPKATGQEARYVLNPYPCTGRTGPNCNRAMVVQNRRALSGGWSDLKSLVLGMGGELITAESGGTKPPAAAAEPVKQRPVQIEGREGYLALWSLPAVAGKSAPAEYCGVIAVKVAPTGNETAVMQICLDRAAEAPPLADMDKIANSMRIAA